MGKSVVYCVVAESLRVPETFSQGAHGVKTVLTTIPGPHGRFLLSFSLEFSGGYMVGNPAADGSSGCGRPAVHFQARHEGDLRN